MGFDAKILENKDSPKWAFKRQLRIRNSGTIGCNRE
jgi:hypothetical protein